MARITTCSFAIALCLGISACGTKQVAGTDSILANSQQQVAAGTTLPKDFKQQLQAKKSKAEQENLAFFSPMHMQQIEQLLASKDATGTVPTANFLAANDLLDKAFVNKKDVQEFLKETLLQADILRELGAEQFDKRSFDKVNEEIKQLIALVEQGQANDALTEQKQLRVSMNALEINTLKNEYLNPALKSFASARDDEAEEFAPKSFVAAGKHIEFTSNFIETNFRDVNTIKRYSDKAIWLSKRTASLAKQSKQLTSLSGKEMEKFIEQNVGAIQKANDRGLGSSLNDAELSIPGAIAGIDKNVSSYVESTTGDNENLKKQVLELTDEIEKLKRAQAFTPEIHATNGSKIDELTIVEVFEEKTFPSEPSIDADEQGFDEVEYVEEPF